MILGCNGTKIRQKNDEKHYFLKKKQEIFR